MQTTAREARWLADAAIDHEGRFTAELPPRGSAYEGGPLEVGIRVTGPEQGGKEPPTVECTLLAFTPTWRPGSRGIQACDWHYAIPAPAWAQIRQHLGAFVIVGRLSARDGTTPLTGVRVAAFDADLVQDDPLGHGSTDTDGWFRIDYPADSMRRTPIPGVSREDGSADIYFTADHAGHRLLDESRTTGRRRDRRNVGPTFCARLRSTAAPLTLTIDIPASGKVTNQPQLTVTGRVSEPCRLTLDDEGVEIDADHHFTAQVALAEGPNRLTFNGTARATGAQARQTLSVLYDPTAPAPPDLTLVTADLDDTGQAHVTGAAAAVEPAAVVDAANTRTGDRAETQVDAEGAFTLTLPAIAGDSITLVARDPAGNTSTPAQLTLSGPLLPPDPADVAPPLPTTTITPLAEATAFLYTGPNPIQTGVDPGTFAPHRVAVLRGRVSTPTGSALPGTTVTIHDRPEYGQTLTRADGHFDLAVNGGTQLVLNYTKDGHLRAQRSVTVPWQDYLSLPDVVLTRTDPAATAVDLTSHSPAQLIRAGTVTDHDGTRRATLFIPAGTTAEMDLSDGTSQPLEHAHIRITEFTVGDTGPEAMPADLPPASAYTYAVSCKADEAAQAGARTVRFSQPVVLYVENFLGFPVGGPVPLGSYDPHATHWTAEPNGLVLAFLATTGGTVDLDITGDGQPDPADALAALGITEAERTLLAATYSPGQQLWRVPLAHFCPQDLNWCALPKDREATFPSSPLAQTDPVTNEGCHVRGSIIDVDNQLLLERIALAGTGLSLCYSSARAQGFTPAYQLHIPLTPEQPPKSLRRVELSVRVEGRRFHQTFPPGPSLTHTFRWDGKDAAGRPAQGARPVTITIGYVYEAVYTSPAVFERAFGLVASAGTSSGGRSGRRPITDATRQEITLTQTYTTTIGAWTTPREAGFGGWSLNLHHAYDPVTQTLYLGDGRQRRAEPLSPVITTIAGTGQAGDNGDGGPATEARIGITVRGMAVAADGTLYFSDTSNNRVRKIDPDGTITTVAGAPGPPQALGDGGPATAARVGQPTGIAIAHDNTLYIVSDRRLRKVGPDGIITTLAVLEGITVQPLHGLTLGPDGALYIAETGRRIFRIGPDSHLSVFAGDGDTFRDNVPATESTLDPFNMIATPDGSLLVADHRQSRIRRITPDGTITTLAGTWPGIHGDGGPANQAQLSAFSLALNPDGTLYITDRSHASIRAITPDGTISTIAGTGQRGTEGDGQRATTAQLNDPEHIALAPDGALYISDALTCRIRKIASPYPGFTAGEIALPSTDGHQIYVFDARRRHTRTLNAYTGAPLMTFHYDDRDRLTSVVHGAPAEHNTVTITRDTEGRPTAITGPSGHHTQLTLNADGYLTDVTDPTNAATTLRYHPGGLLATLANPLGHQHTYTYEADGRLHSDTNPAGGTTTLAAKRTNSTHAVTALTTEGRESSFTEERLPSGITHRTAHCCGEHDTVTTAAPDGSRTTTTADGTVYTGKTGPNPRWSMQAPFLAESTVTTPAGLCKITTTEQTADLADPGNPLSLTRLTQRTTLDGRIYITTFDVTGQPRTGTTVTATSPSGLQQQLVLDAAGRPAETRTAGRAGVTLAYDDRGRLSTRTERGGAQVRITRFDYNDGGRLSRISTPDGAITTLSYDEAGRATGIVRADGSAVQLTRDPAGRLVALKTPSGATHRFEYTALGQVSRYLPPSGGGAAANTVWEWDTHGQLTEGGKGDGRTASRTYDEGGRLATVTVEAGRYDFEYHSVTGQLIRAHTPQGLSISYRYDGSLLIGEEYSGAVVGTVRRSYDDRLLIQSTAVNDEIPVMVDRDIDGDIEANGPIRVTRDPNTGRVTKVSLADVHDEHGYDVFGMLATYRASHAGTELYAVTWHRDAVGRIVEVDETAAGVNTVTQYGYDVLGQLTRVTRNGAVTITYTYDAQGNRTARRINGTEPLVSQYDQRDRLVSVGDDTYQYTPAGDLASTTGPSGAVRYNYDELGALTRVERTDQVVEYLSDGWGRRVRRIVNGVADRGYLYDGQALVAEVDAGHKVVSRFHYGHRGRTPLAMVRDGRAYRILCDHLGSVRLVVDAETGVIAQQLEYDEFGKVIQDSSPGFQPFGFCGGLWDPVGGLVRFGARDYDPDAGRWTTPDPALFASGDINLYRYAGNDPVNRLDRTGSVTEVIEQVPGFSVFGASAAGTLLSAEALTAIALCSGAFGLGFVAGYGLARLDTWLSNRPAAVRSDEQGSDASDDVGEDVCEPGREEEKSSGRKRAPSKYNPEDIIEEYDKDFPDPDTRPEWMRNLIKELEQRIKSRKW
ncbi:hypothetical protein OG568_58370 (plasmid) [Streptomyces sp. NBC_01450]|uniref:NHL domain-containing protein n=1 Tax=Streptomyces sp. NBC_01450 TaxID=2903871 RepID=UPI002E30D631|nr:RHS repeat-associated core domain-containing protein [Streptomyces sp. NBC_01450]